MPCKLMAHFYYSFHFLSFYLFFFHFSFSFFFSYTYLRGFNDFKAKQMACGLFEFFWRKYECSCTLCLFAGYHWATWPFFPGF